MVACTGAAIARNGEASKASAPQRKKVRLFMIEVSFSRCAKSNDTQHCHHPGHLVIGDVTMQHPVAGIIGNERDVDGFFRWYENRVSPLPIRHRRSIAVEHAEAVAVQM